MRISRFWQAHFITNILLTGTNSDCGGLRMSLGTRADTIFLSNLMDEVKTAAVETQSDMLNQVRLMEAK